jgi:hypothetical protein
MFTFCFIPCVIHFKLCNETNRLSEPVVICSLNVSGKKCRDTNMSGYTGKERWRESRYELLPWTWRESGLCIVTIFVSNNVNNNPKRLYTLINILQVFAYTKRQQIMSDDNCLDASSPEGPVKLVRCHGMGGNQAWTYNTQVFILSQNCVYI